MKKLLSLISVISLTTTGINSIISCGKKSVNTTVKSEGGSNGSGSGNEGATNSGQITPTPIVASITSKVEWEKVLSGKTDSETTEKRKLKLATTDRNKEKFLKTVWDLLLKNDDEIKKYSNLSEKDFDSDSTFASSTTEVNLKVNATSAAKFNIPTGKENIKITLTA